MITSEKILNTMRIANDLLERNGLHPMKNTEDMLKEYCNQQDKLTTTVKRYFELKAKGITSEEETNEHLELLNQINEMVGVE